MLSLSLMLTLSLMLSLLCSFSHSLCLQLKTTFSTDSRVQNMFDILLDEEMDKDKKEKVYMTPK